jgi:hypothetical protein
MQNQQGWPQGQYPQQQAQPVQQPAVQSFGYLPTQDVIMASYQRAEKLREEIAKARAGGRGKYRFFDVPGPNGGEWSTAQPGYTGWRGLWVAYPWRQGVNNYKEAGKHFWKSTARPQGTGGYCTQQADGTFHCAIDDAYERGLELGMKDIFGRCRSTFIYQGFPYFWIPGQTVSPDFEALKLEDGSYAPMILEAGSTLHAAIQNLLGGNPQENWARLFHYDQGRPIGVSKAKTGPSRMDVEWGAMTGFDALPLHPGLRQIPLLDLDDFAKPMTPEEQLQAIKDMGLPLPAHLGGNGAQHFPTHGMAGQGGGPAPGQPGWNPQMAGQPQGQMQVNFGQPPQQQWAQQGQGPQQQYGGAPLPVPQAQGQMAPTQSYQMPPNPFPTQQGYQMPPPPPGQQQHQQTQQGPGGYPSPQPGMPPNPNQAPAPPLSGAPPQQGAGNGTPGPGQGLVQLQKRQAIEGEALVLPLSGIALPNGRESCFGKHEPADPWCHQCPPWIKQQCVPQTPKKPSELADAQQKLMGMPVAEIELEIPF